MWGNFFKKNIIPSFDKPKPVNVDKIDQSFDLLRSTTAEVSAAAISAAKVLQDRLVASEHRFYRTIDSIEDFVLVKNGKGQWCTLNKFGQRIYGFHHAEYKGKTDLELAEMFPRLAKILKSCAESDVTVWESGEALRFETTVPCLKKCYDLDIIKTPTYYPDGTRREMIVVGRDMTEIKEKSKREKACFTALNSASDAIIIIDHRARIFFCNDKFLALFKLNNYQDTINKPLYDIIPDFPQYKYMWETVRANNIWVDSCPLKTLKIEDRPCECPHRLPTCVPESCLTHKMHINVLPMMNGAPVPIYYICTFKIGCALLPPPIRSPYYETSV
jgi:PAS domain-containing protein